MKWDDPSPIGYSHILIQSASFATGPRGQWICSLSAKLTSYALLPDMELQKDMEVNLQIQLTFSLREASGWMFSIIKCTCKRLKDEGGMVVVGGWFRLVVLV